MDRAIRSHRYEGIAVLFAALLLPSEQVTAGPATVADAQAQSAHAKGACGSLAPGTGLRDGRGWIVSMMPGKHEFRIRGGGDVYLTTARIKGTMDFDATRPYYIAIEHAPAGAVLEWKFLGSDWAPVATYFLYPPTN